MNRELDELKNKWKDAEKIFEGKPLSIEHVIALAKAKRKVPYIFFMEILPY